MYVLVSFEKLRHLKKSKYAHYKTNKTFLRKMIVLPKLMRVIVSEWSLICTFLKRWFLTKPKSFPANMCSSWSINAWLIAFLVSRINPEEHISITGEGSLIHNFKKETKEGSPTVIWCAFVAFEVLRLSFCKPVQESLTRLLLPRPACLPEIQRTSLKIRLMGLD